MRGYLVSPKIHISSSAQHDFPARRGAERSTRCGRYDASQGFQWMHAYHAGFFTNTRIGLEGISANCVLKISMEVGLLYLGETRNNSPS